MGFFIIFEPFASSYGQVKFQQSWGRMFWHHFRGWCQKIDTFSAHFWRFSITTQNAKSPVKQALFTVLPNTENPIDAKMGFKRSWVQIPPPRPTKKSLKQGLFSYIAYAHFASICAHFRFWHHFDTLLTPKRFSDRDKNRSLMVQKKDASFRCVLACWL